MSEMEEELEKIVDLLKSKDSESVLLAINMIRTLDKYIFNCLNHCYKHLYPASVGYLTLNSCLNIIEISDNNFFRRFRINSLIKAINDCINYSEFLTKYGKSLKLFEFDYK